MVRLWYGGTLVWWDPISSTSTPCIPRLSYFFNRFITHHDYISYTRLSLSMMPWAVAIHPSPKHQFLYTKNTTVVLTRSPVKWHIFVQNVSHNWLNWAEWDYLYFPFLRENQLKSRSKPNKTKKSGIQEKLDTAIYLIPQDRYFRSR